MKKKCHFYNHRKGDCSFGSGGCVYNYDACPVILNEDEDVKASKNSKSTCGFCKKTKGVEGYFCENKKSEWYGEHCVEADACEPMYCSDREEKGG